MKSLAELAAIRARMIEQVNLRKDDNIDTRIVVGMATCGIAAGARPVMLEFIEELKRRGLELSRVAYVLTRACEKRYEEIYDQMDRYTAEKHVIGGTLRVGSVGYPFWRDKFIQEAQRYLEEQRGQVDA